MGRSDSIPIVEGEIGPPRSGFVHRLCIRKADEAWGEAARRRPRGYKILQSAFSRSAVEAGTRVVDLHGRDALDVKFGAIWHRHALIRRPAIPISSRPDGGGC